MQTILKYTLALLLALLVAVLPSCKNERPPDIIPFVPVNIVINLNEPTAFNLQPIGGWIYVEGGSKGLIIFHADVNTYYAFDRNCTYDAYSNCATVNVLPDEPTAVDTCCGSRFNLFGGVVSNPPAQFGLVQYQCIVEGTQLRIFN